jgi:hypothetical protein
MRLFPRAVTAAALAFAVGCGGGGGAGELTISQQNAEELAAAGVGAVSMLEGMSEMTDGLSELFNPSAQMMPCDAGNVMLNIYDPGANGLSTGDYASLDFNSCVIDLGEGALTFNGSFYLRAEDVTGDPLSGPFTRAIYADYGLTATVFGANMVIDGALTASLSSPDGVTVVSDITGGSFRALAQAGDAVFSGSINNFNCGRSVNTTTGDYSVNFEATVYASGLAGSARFETTVPFTGTGDEHPSAGTFVATGANGATVTLIALDNVNVQILIDADWDGVNETTINTTWDALEGNTP